MVSEPVDDASSPRELHLIDAERLSVLWGVKKSWIYDEVEAGRLPAVRLGRQPRFRMRELLEYLDG
jgi:excisionase family DNA binding protein